MAKFCSNCGKELVEGKCLECEKNKKGKVLGIDKKNFDFDFKACTNAFIDMLKGMFIRPKDTIAKYADEKHMSYGIIAMVLCGILTGVFGYLLVNELIGSLLGLLYGGYASFGSSAEIPVFKTILTTALYTMISFATIIGVVYFMLKVVFKKEVSIKKIVASFGPLAIFNGVSLLISIILLFISVKLMIIVYMIFALCYVVYTIQAIKISTEVEDNYLAYTYVPAVMVAALVVGYILPKLFS